MTWKTTNLSETPKVGCIAVIGGDGAGKTTVTRRVVESQHLPFRYVYMGINIGSSNVALPTSRLLHRLRHGSGRPTLHRPGTAQAAPRARGGPKAALRSGARLLYRLSEEWYRQILCWLCELRGEVVLTDRHFLYDFYQPAERRAGRGLTERIHLWLLEHVYPRPDLVLFLDAPTEVLLARKGEASREFLEDRRAAMLEIGAGDARFVRVDATQPLEAVISEIEGQIKAHFARRFGASGRRQLAGSEAHLLRALDAAVIATVPRRRREPRQLALRAASNLERLASAVLMLDRLAPGLADALARRLTAVPPALGACSIEILDYGTSGTVYRLDTPHGPRALKVYRRSLGRPLGEQYALLANYAERYRAVAAWYASARVVTASSFLILAGPILGGRVAAVLQPLITGPKLDFLNDLSEEQALARLCGAPELAEQFRAFARVTLDQCAKEERCLDLVGRQNLMLVGEGRGARLAIVDFGFFELPELRCERPAAYAVLQRRIARLELLLSAVG